MYFITRELNKHNKDVQINSSLAFNLLLLYHISYNLIKKVTKKSTQKTDKCFSPNGSHVIFDYSAESFVQVIRVIVED